MADDNIQHGIDDNPSGDAEKGAALGGLGGAAVGAAAGSLAGPIGTLIGAAVGAVSGAIASGVAVAAVDAVDNDNTVSGLGDGATHTGTTDADGTVGTHVHSDGTVHSNTDDHLVSANDSITDTTMVGHNVVTGEDAHTDAGKSGLATGAVVGGLVGTAVGGPVGAIVGGTLGSLAGGVAGDASETAAEGTTPGSGYTTGTAMTDTTAYGTTGTDYGTAAGYDDTTGMLPAVTRAEYDAMPEADRMKVRLVEEELHVGKESRQTGEVEISKRIVEEQVSVPVTLEREEVIIHHTAVSGDASGTIGEGQTIVVPVREEFAQVTKTSHVTGEVEIEKRTVATEKTVSDTVRREELVVDGDVVDDTTTKY